MTTTTTAPATGLLGRVRRTLATIGTTHHTDLPGATSDDDAPSPARTVDVGIIGSPHRNLIVNKSGTWGWFFAGEEPWSHLRDEQRHTAMHRYAHLLASLATSDTPTLLHWRLTGSPFDSAGWARRVDEAHPAPEPGSGPRTLTDTTRLPDPEGGVDEDGNPVGETFDDLLVRTQQRMGELGGRVPSVAFGVRLTDRRMTENELVKLTSGVPLVERDAGLETHRLWYRRVTEIVAEPGLRARPLEPTELRWLIHSSVGMGAPVPPMLADIEDPAAMFGSVRATASPLAGSTKVSALRGGAQFTNHVIVLHVAKIASPRDIDDRGLMPLLGWTQMSVPFPVEVSVDQRLILPTEMKRAASFELNRALSIAKEWERRDRIPPPEIGRAIERAVQVADEVSTGDRVTQLRSQGQILFAVWGDTAEQASSRAAQLIALASEQQGITLSQEYGQFKSLRSFIPGAGKATTGGPDLRLPLDAFASTMPHAATTAGDLTGQYMGPIMGSGGLFLLEGLQGAKVNMSNVIAFLGGQGGGKSATAGSILAWHARMGVRSVGNDPTGMWARLTGVSYLRNDSRHVDLGSVRDGTLTPSMLVPEPRLEHYDGMEEYEQARKDAAFRRVQLTTDALRDLLPHGLLVSNDAGKVVDRVRDAVADVGGEYGANPWDVVAILQKQGGLSARIARSLESSTQFKGGALIFPPRHGEAPERYTRALLEQATLTIVSMQGLPLAPEGNADRASWSEEQAQAVPVMRLAAALSNMVVYGDKDPKVVMNDEIGLSGGQGAASFGATMRQYLYDSRKWNALIGILGQNPNMFTALNEEVANLLGQIWAFRMAEDAAVKTLKLMGLPTDYGFEQSITDLRPGEALVRDWTKRFPRVQVDRATWDDELFHALDSNPQSGEPEREEIIRRLGVA